MTRKMVRDTVTTCAGDQQAEPSLFLKLAPKIRAFKARSCSAWRRRRRQLPASLDTLSIRCSLVLFFPLSLAKKIKGLAEGDLIWGEKQVRISMRNELGRIVCVVLLTGNFWYSPLEIVKTSPARRDYQKGLIVNRCHLVTLTKCWQGSKGTGPVIG